MYSRPTAPQTVGGVLDDIFKLYMAALPQCWPVALISAVISLVPSIYIALKLGAVSTARVADLQKIMDLYTSPAVWGSYLVLFVVSILFSFALLIRVANVANGEEGTTASAIARALALLPRILGATLLFALAYVVGFILLVVPGIIWSVSFLLAGAFIVIEDAGAVESLSRSRRLIKGNWWRTLAILSIAVIMGYLLLFFVGLVGGIVGAIVSADRTTLLIVSTVISSAIRVFVMPLYSAALLGVYFDLKLRKEGGDLSDRVAALNNA